MTESFPPRERAKVLAAAAAHDCPSWCGDSCDGGTHWRFVKAADHIPADRTRQRSDHPTDLPSTPLVAAHLRWRQSEGHGVELVLHEYRDDVEWVFSLGVAFEFLTQILDAYVAAMDELPEVPMPLSETWDSFQGLAARVGHRLDSDRAAVLAELASRADTATS